MKGRPHAILRTLHHLLDVLQMCGAPLAGALACGMGIILISLWFWREAVRVADGTGATHPNLAVYSVRLAAIAGIAAAQILLLHFVVGRIYRPTVFDYVLKCAAGLICAVSLAAAVAFVLLAK
jgi:hypothetical protein